MITSVLVVEDDASSREALSSALGDLGYGVVAVQSNELAAGSLQALFFDVLLVIVQPDNLYAVETAIAAKHDQTNLKIIVASDATLLEVLRPHVDAFVQKPYTMKAVDAAIRQVTAIRRPREFRDMK